MLARLEDEDFSFQLTLSMTPSLTGMLRDPLLQKRYNDYLERTILLADDDIGRNRAHGDHERRALAQFYRDHLQEIENTYNDVWKRDLVGAFRYYQESGCLEIIASAATHGLLPLLLESPEAVRAQVRLGCDSYRECFGESPKGFWLPECAYSAEVEPFLMEEGIQWFAVEAHGLYHGEPTPANAIFKPCRTPNGLAVFGRDPESSRQVWSAEDGYPGAPDYREFYRDLGHELSLEELREYLETSDVRRFTGLKYHRITGPTEEKALYDPEAASRLAKTHAAGFIDDRAAQLASVESAVEGEPVVVSAFDAELFGHWWFEGVQFLEELIRHAAVRRNSGADGFCITSPSAYLKRSEWLERVQPSASTWGYNGHLESWLDEENTWIYPHLHHAAAELTSLAKYAAAGKPSARQRRCLSQMARELLLAQSSDWAFLMKTGTAREYAVKRTRDHLHRFRQLRDQLVEKRIDQEFLAGCETRDTIFPKLDWRIYAPR